MSREEFAKLVDAKYDEIKTLNEEPTFMDYEKGFVELWTELGRRVLNPTLVRWAMIAAKKKIQHNPRTN